MYKIIILIIIIPQLFSACSFKEDKEITQQLDCPKHFIISEADTILFENNAILSISSKPDINCYRILNDPNSAYFDITNNYLLSNIPNDELFEGKFNSLFFVTDREEDFKIHSISEEVFFNNDIKWNTKIDSPFLDKVEINSYTSFTLKLSDYSKGLRFFSAVN